MPADIQHENAQKLLRLIEREGVTGKLTYQGVAKLLKRPNPQDDGRAFGSICDLLDAAACLAGVPALALFAVKNAEGKINPLAWQETPEKREAILTRSKNHTFTAADFAKIRSRLNDFDSEPAARIVTTGYAYVRDLKLRDKIIRRANGVCEYCGLQGFLQEGGGRYLEGHHVIHLKNQGPDSLTNLIALCASDHREVHFGTVKRQRQMDSEMLVIIATLIS